MEDNLCPDSCMWDRRETRAMIVMRNRVVTGMLIAGLALCIGRPSLGAKGGLPADLASAAADYDRAQIKGDEALCAGRRLKQPPPEREISEVSQAHCLAVRVLVR